jgi:hypothetical protein
MIRILILTPEASLSILLQEILAWEDYETIEAAHSYEGFQATTMARAHDVPLDAQYLIVW